MNRKDAAVWNKGDTIYKKGDPPEYAYLVVSGLVEFFGEDGVALGQAGPDEVFGEISSYLNRNHSVTAKAKTYLVAKFQGDIEGKKIIIQGLGNVGYHAAKF